MSHTVVIKDVKVTNAVALIAAAKRLGLEVRELSKTNPQRLFSTNHDNGHAVQLKDWRYPIVIEKSGKIAFDNYHGAWGNQSQLDQFLQYYVTEEARLNAEAEGWLVRETVDQKTGEIILECEENGF